MRLLLKLPLLALAIPLALVALGAGTPRPAPATGDPGAYTIAIKDFDFTPRDLVIPVGSRVTWINKDEEPHKVAEVDSAFTSQPLDTDEGFSYEFKTPGTYRYFCTLHPQMTGKIVVQ